MISSIKNKFKLYISILSILFLFVFLLSIQYSGSYWITMAHNHHTHHVSNMLENQQQQHLSQIPSSASSSNFSSSLQSMHKSMASSTSSPSSLTSTYNQKISSSIPNVPINSNKVIILTFGDGYQSQYTLAKPILDQYGYKGNFFVTCNKVGTVNKMTWPELVQIYKEGNVIGSKTVNYGTKAMEGKDLNNLPAAQLEFEVGQSKQCLANHGINTDYFAVPMNLANDNATVINTISKYYTLAINGHSNLMYLHCNGGRESPSQTDCRTYFDNGTLTPENRYSVGEWSEQHIKNGRSYNDSQMFAKFITEVNSQDKFNTNGIINAIPLVAYHDIVLLPDVTLSSEPSATTLNLFSTEIKYLHDNGYRVLTFYNLGYDDNTNTFYLKT
jgi:hypothetical protein